MLKTKPEHEDFDKSQQDQEKEDLSLILNRFQTEGTNIYDFGSYVNSFAGMSTYTYPLFVNFFAVRSYSVNSREIQFPIS